MLSIRRSEERGRADFGWLDSRHTFSFGGYHDPQYMGFGNLRVINEDRVAVGGGFAPHAHRDMEIITYVLAGGLAHKDSLENGAVIVRGDVQRMTAGTGIRHSEYNAYGDRPVHFLQIWVLPERVGLEPSYEQKTFGDEDKQNNLLLLGSQDGRQGSVMIHQDVNLYGAKLDAGRRVEHDLQLGRSAWLQVVEGTIVLNGVTLVQGDGCGLADVSSLEMVGGEDGSHCLLFDMGLAP